MKKQLPKNVRQIGNVSDNPKIYVEDYVDTFFNQMCERAEQSPKGAFLVGEVVKEEEDDYIYIYGALHMKQLSVRGKEIQLGENTWKWACEQCKQYFGDAGIIGWCLVASGQALEVNHAISKIHQKYFPKDKSIFVIKDAETKEEKYYMRKFHDLLEWNGHYIYYEKNAEMQSYMIDSRKKNGVTPSEIFEDRAATNFRNVIKERMEKKEKKKRSGISYMATAAVVLLLCGAGITALQKYEKMGEVKKVMSNLTDSLAPKKENKTVLQITPATDQKQEESDDHKEGKDTDDSKSDSGADFKKEETGKDNPSDAKQPESNPKDSASNEDPTTDENPTTDSDQKSDPLQESPSKETVATESMYVVRQGDTLASISRKQYGDTSHINAICKANGLEDGNLIFVGQKLLLP